MAKCKYTFGAPQCKGCSNVWQCNINLNSTRLDKQEADTKEILAGINSLVQTVNTLVVKSNEKDKLITQMRIENKELKIQNKTLKELLHD